LWSIVNVFYIIATNNKGIEKIMILEYIKKVVGIALTTPSSTLVHWIAPKYQRKGYEYSCGSSHKTSLGEGRINWYANPTSASLAKVFNLLPLKNPSIIQHVTKNTVHKSKVIFLLLALTSLLATGPIIADNISTTDKHAYAENAGWLDFNSTHEQVTVYDDHLEGYVWSEAVGWIRLGTYTTGDAHSYTNNSNTTYGVNNDGSGNLSGYGWSENAGWVNFNPSHSQVFIDATTGDFDGYAWSESIGWIHFQNDSPAAYKVQRSLDPAYVPDPGYAGGSIGFSVTGQSLSGISITTADGNKPAGMESPYGKISYEVTSAVGGEVTVSLTFTTELPEGFTVHKVNDAGDYSPIPEDAPGGAGYWHQVSANTLEVTLKDGEKFDLDGKEDGSILDPIVILVNAATSATPIPTLSIWGLILMIALLSILGTRKVKR
jgi:hypothetical protein